MFHDVRLPEHIEAGASIGPRFQTSIISLASGREQRNVDWSQEIIEADISYGMMNADNGEPYEDAVVSENFRDILSFFRARRGMAYGFRFRAWDDYQAFGEPIGVGNGANRTFQLIKSYGDYRRRITRPVWDTVIIRVDGIQRSYVQGSGLGEVTVNLFDYDGDPETPASAPLNGTVIDWFGEFDVPVRFDTDIAQVNLTAALSGEVPNIRLVGLSE